jgi:hypothetical protein
MKNKLIALALLTFAVGVQAKDITQKADETGKYSASERVVLDNYYAERIKGIAEIQAAVKQGDRDAVKQIGVKAKAMQAERCAIYKKNPVDYANAMCKDPEEQKALTGWMYKFSTNRMTDKENHLAVLFSEDQGSTGLSQISIQCEAGKPESTMVFFSTKRTYLSKDFARYSYRLDKEEVISNKGQVTADKVGVLVARGSNAVELTKKLLNVSGISTTVTNYDGRSYEGNFDNIQNNKANLQKLMTACAMN